MGTSKRMMMYKALISVLLFNAAFAQQPVWDEEFVQEIAETGELNVNGGPLAQCSTSTMAMTGFTRTGKCVEQNDDTGSHHVCIDLTSTSTNFCQATGQPNWCAEKGQCMGDHIQKVVCEATNMQAVKAYKQKLKENPDATMDGGRIADAMACLKKKCNIV